MTDSGGELQWYFSQVKGTMDDEVNEADIISTVEFSDDGELLATGDKGGRIVIFQREQPTKSQMQQQSSTSPYFRTDYNVYSTFQSHEAEFDYLKSLEIEEKINKIKWLRRKNIAHFLLSTNDKTVKLWKIRERNKQAVMAENSMNGHMMSVRDDLNGYIRNVSIPVFKYMDRTEVEAIPKRIFANAHTYHINSISLNSDQETFMSADDLRINLWHIEITNQSFNIVDIKPANMEELTEVITAAEFHPKECNLFVYGSSKGIIRLCDMRQSALCDNQAKIFEEREDPTTKNFFSEIISSISDVKFSHSGRYLCTRDYLHIKIWDLNMENRPVETYCVHDYLRNKLCILYENDCIFDKFECNWSSNDEYILSGSYNNFFKSFHRTTKQEQMFECSREQSKPRQQLRPKRVINPNLNGQTNTNSNCSTTNGSASPSLSKRNAVLNGGKQAGVKDEINVDNLDFTKKILHTSWHPKDNLVAIAATNNLYIFYGKDSYSPLTMTTTSTNVLSTNSLSSSTSTSQSTTPFSNTTPTSTTSSSSSSSSTSTSSTAGAPTAPAPTAINNSTTTTSTTTTTTTSSHQPVPNTNSNTTNLLNGTSSNLTMTSSSNNNGILQSQPQLNGSVLANTTNTQQSNVSAAAAAACSSATSCMNGLAATNGSSLLNASPSAGTTTNNSNTNNLNALTNSTNLILNNILPLSSNSNSTTSVSSSSSSSANNSINLNSSFYSSQTPQTTAPTTSMSL